MLCEKLCHIGSTMSCFFKHNSSWPEMILKWSRFWHHRSWKSWLFILTFVWEPLFASAIRSELPRFYELPSLHRWADSSEWMACRACSDPRNMVTFGVVTDTRLARVLGFNSSAAALMLRPLNTSLVCTACLFIFRFLCVNFLVMFLVAVTVHGTTFSL